MTPSILPYKTYHPSLSATCFVAPSAVVIGNVRVEAEASIWFHCTIRGDMERITIGEESNIQDNSVIHIASKGLSTTIGARVTVGHGAILHACVLEDDSFIGMGAVVLDGAVIESGAFVAAGSLVAPRTKAVSGYLWAGNPAKARRPLKEEEEKLIASTPKIYKALAQDYALATQTRHPQT